MGLLLVLLTCFRMPEPRPEPEQKYPPIPWEFVDFDGEIIIVTGMRRLNENDPRPRFDEWDWLYEVTCIRADGVVNRRFGCLAWVHHHWRHRKKP